MPIEKERFSFEQFIPPWVRHEHWARFEFASHFVKNKMVVDCACGIGAGARLFAKTSARVQAFDLSAEAIATSAKDASNKLTFTVSDACHLPLPGASADVYVSLETIEHLPDDEKFLTEVKRVLKPGGTFICSTPNRAVTNPGTKISDRPFNKFHVREYSQEEFLALLQKYFSQIELYGQNPQCPYKTKFFNFLAKKISRPWVARLLQLLKMPRFILDTMARHQVHPVQAQKDYEYLIAVCN